MITPTTDDRTFLDGAGVSRRSTTAGGWSVRGSTVLVATNGSPASGAAVRVASHLARLRGVRPTVVRAYQSSPAPFLSPPVPVPAVDHEATTRASAYEELQRVVPEEPGWPVRVAVGAPQHVIVARARAVDAALLLMGLRKGDPLQRAFGTELLLQVIRHSRCPVLATTASMHALPARVVVGLDIDAPNVRVAQAAAAVAAHGASVELVFIGVPRQRATDPLFDDEAHAWHVAESFRRLREQLASRADLQVRTTVLTGVTGDALRDVAMATRADLVALGTGRQRFMERLLFGSITARDLREERWSVLAVPPE